MEKYQTGRLFSLQKLRNAFWWMLLGMELDDISMFSYSKPLVPFYALPVIRALN